MSISSQTSNVITDRLLRSWIRCKRKAWLDQHGDSTKRAWTAHRTLQLDLQHRCFSALIPSKPGTGIAACKKGCPGIIGLRLKGILPPNQLIEAHPPILKRIKGNSRWGDFAYMPVLTRQGHKLTREHRLSLCFTGLLLEQFQNSKVKKGMVIAQGNNGLEIQTLSLYGKLQQQLIDAVRKLNSDLNKSEPPPIISDRRKCTICSWRVVCNSEAAANGYLSEVSGIGPKRQQIMEELGIKKIQDLAKINPDELSNGLKNFGGQHKDIAHKLISQARCQETNHEVRLNSNPVFPELENAPGVLLYDIESDPDARDDFLHGFIRLNRKSNGEWDLKGAKYQPILALREHGKDYCWGRLSKKLNHFKDWPILHYGETESISLLNLAKLQDTNEEELSALKSRLIDVHYRLRKHWLLPVNSYRLKTVASWLGFRWHQRGADGARALLLWRQWRREGKELRGPTITLKSLFRYNKDDCLATWAVINWMIKQDR
tara:strand:- start:4564 stop:6027 length:1464 start_codon:yes stop_codon:yes gene_type:complete